MILLEEEIRAISNLSVPDPCLDIPFQYVQAGAEVQLKKVVEWGSGICLEHHSATKIPPVERRRCLDCWQALLKEVE